MHEIDTRDPHAPSLPARPSRSPGRLRAVALVALLAFLPTQSACGTDDKSPADEGRAVDHKEHEPNKSAGIERRAPSPDAKVYFITPGNGQTVSSPVQVRFGLTGMGVAPAGVLKEGTGHHHLLVDTDLPDLNLPVPNDDKHRHFGGGQTETAIDLAPGQHTLQLLLADERHVPHDPPVVSEQITITVE